MLALGYFTCIWECIMSSNPFAVLVKSRKFWLSVIAVIQTIIFSMLPSFPDEIWQAINVILLFHVGMIAVEDSAKKIASRGE